jgi:phosphatidylinositol alpha-1,6-mannosyltransferase
MSGIAGIYAYHYAANAVDRAELWRIREQMAARGPDGAGEWYSPDERVGLGQCRLAIHDLSERGTQPMASPDGKLAISLNGEIDNYRDLRQSLEAKGYVLRSQSETELLLHLYAEKGEALLEDLRGRFTFALWDAERNALLLARDPYGIKPLYYSDDGWTLRFASQVEALLAGGRVSRDQEPAGWAGFRLFGSVPESFTTYREIRAVPAGSLIWVDRIGSRRAKCYFSIARQEHTTAPAQPIANCARQGFPKNQGRRFSTNKSRSPLPATGFIPQTSVRILALVTDAFGGHGGIAQYNRDFLSALAACERVDDVLVLPRATPSLPGELPSRLRQLEPVQGRFAYSLAALRAARAHSPIHVVFCGHPFMAPLAAIIAKLTRSPLWIQVHGVDAWDDFPIIYRRSIAAANLITAVSRYTRHRLLEWCPIDPARVKVLPNTVDGRFCPGPKPGYLVERHALQGKKVLMTAARLAAVDRYKGHDRVMRVLPDVLVEHPSTVYLIVGDGDDRQHLESLAAQLGVAEKVIFAGRVPTDELPDYYRVANLFVMPSTGEGFGIVFLEAMACGIPAIGGNKDGSLDALADGATGIAVDPEDASALAAAICAALRAPAANPKGAARFGQNAFGAHVRALVGSLVEPYATAVVDGRSWAEARIPARCNPVPR